MNCMYLNCSFGGLTDRSGKKGKDKTRVLGQESQYLSSKCFRKAIKRVRGKEVDDEIM